MIDAMATILFISVNIILPLVLFLFFLISLKFSIIDFEKLRKTIKNFKINILIFLVVLILTVIYVYFFSTRFQIKLDLVYKCFLAWFWEELIKYFSVLLVWFFLFKDKKILFRNFWELYLISSFFFWIIETFVYLHFWDGIVSIIHLFIHFIYWFMFYLTYNYLVDLVNNVFFRKFNYIFFSSLIALFLVMLFHTVYDLICYNVINWIYKLILGFFFLFIYLSLTSYLLKTK